MVCLDTNISALKGLPLMSTNCYYCGLTIVKVTLNLLLLRCMLFANYSLQFSSDCHEIWQALFSSLTATSLKI